MPVLGIFKRRNVPCALPSTVSTAVATTRTRPAMRSVLNYFFFHNNNTFDIYISGRIRNMSRSITGWLACWVTPWSWRMSSSATTRSGFNRKSSKRPSTGISWWRHISYERIPLNTYKHHCFLACWSLFSITRRIVSKSLVFLLLSWIEPCRKF